MNPPALYLHWLWLFLGCCAVLALLAADFIFVPIKFSLPYEDKFYHALAHALPACWFFMLYQSTYERCALLTAFLALAILNEVLQPLSPYHTFDLWDIVANLAGIGIAWFWARGRSLVLLNHFLANNFKA